MKQKTTIAFVAGALLALIAWWPLEGALTAISWSRAADKIGLDDIAIDTLINTYTEFIVSSNHHEHDFNKSGQRNCLQQLDELVTKQWGYPVRSAAMLLQTAIYDRRNKMNDRAVDDIARKSLRGLPNIALGALQGCVEGSLITSLCRRYVGQRLDAAITTHAQELKTKFDTNDADAIRMGCTAVSGTAERTK